MTDAAAASFDATDACALCLEPLGAAEVRRLRCSHPFHAACVDALRAHPPLDARCPLCRERVTPPDAPCLDLEAGPAAAAAPTARAVAAPPARPVAAAPAARPVAAPPARPVAPPSPAARTCGCALAALSACLLLTGVALLLTWVVAAMASSGRPDTALAAFGRSECVPFASLFAVASACVLDGATRHVLAPRPQAMAGG